MLLIILYEKSYCHIDYEKLLMLLMYKSNIEGYFLRAYYKKILFLCLSFDIL